MAKNVLRRVLVSNSLTGSYYFYCPGCEHGHVFNVKPGRKQGDAKIPVWQWDGNMQCPTFSPSLLNRDPSRDRICHLFLKGGKLQFLPDCTHKLAGQTVDMVELQ